MSTILNVAAPLRPPMPLSSNDQQHQLQSTAAADMSDRDAVGAGGMLRCLLRRLRHSPAAPTAPSRVLSALVGNDATTAATALVALRTTIAASLMFTFVLSMLVPAESVPPFLVVTTPGSQLPLSVLTHMTTLVAADLLTVGMPLGLRSLPAMHHTLFILLHTFTMTILTTAALRGALPPTTLNNCACLVTILVETLMARWTSRWAMYIACVSWSATFRCVTEAIGLGHYIAGVTGARAVWTPYGVAAVTIAFGIVWAIENARAWLTGESVQDAIESELWWGRCECQARSWDEEHGAGAVAIAAATITTTAATKDCSLSVEAAKLQATFDEVTLSLKV